MFVNASPLTHNGRFLTTSKSKTEARWTKQKKQTENNLSLSLPPEYLTAHNVIYTKCGILQQPLRHRFISKCNERKQMSTSRQSFENLNS